MVLAITSDTEYKMFAYVEDVPKGAVMFVSAVDMADQLTIETMDAVRRKLVGIHGEDSATKLEAAGKLWAYMTRDPDEGGLNVLVRDVQRKFYNTKRELFIAHWAAVKPYWMDLNIMEQQTIMLLRRDGRKIWTWDQLANCLEDGQGELRWGDRSWRPFCILRSRKLEVWGALWHLSFYEYFSNPKYRRLRILPD